MLFFLLFLFNMFDLIKENVKHIQNANSQFYKERKNKEKKLSFKFLFVLYYIILYSKQIQ